MGGKGIRHYRSTSRIIRYQFRGLLQRVYILPTTISSSSSSSPSDFQSLHFHSPSTPLIQPTTVLQIPSTYNGGIFKLCSSVYRRCQKGIRSHNGSQEEATASEQDCPASLSSVWLLYYHLFTPPPLHPTALTPLRRLFLEAADSSGLSRSEAARPYH